MEMANITEVTSVTDRDILAVMSTARFEKFYAGMFVDYIEGCADIDADDILTVIREMFKVPKQKED
jgi:hypothetical protein